MFILSLLYFCQIFQYHLLVFPIKDYIVPVLAKNQLTDNVIEVVTETGGMEWETGQYVSIDVSKQVTRHSSLVTNGQSPVIIRRSYSMSTLSRSGKVGFIVDTKPLGPGSQFFQNLKVGDEISFKGPLGKFTLDSPSKQSRSKNFVFVATGTGIGPIRAMIDELLQVPRTKYQGPNIKLHFGLRTQKDIFWREHFNSLRDKFKFQFDYQIVLSRPGIAEHHSAHAWQGLTGHVNEHVMSFVTRQSSLVTSGQSPMTFYLCGNLGMITKVRSGLKEKGVREENIYFESYYSTEDSLT